VTPDHDRAISVRGAGKQYTKYVDAPALVSGLLRRRGRSGHSKFWAVRDLDLDVARGENVGLIGRNGSGKSTLLQMLCGVTAPSAGEVRVRGRIAPLISVGVGFHPELTGRENIYRNAAILGMPRQATDRKLEAIVDFSGVEDFLDTPLKFYSSGMSVRLGFAVAAHAEPEVFLVDEVLAVGDLSFQLKSFDFIERLRLNGTTVIVVSHNLAAIQRLCPRSLVLDTGRCQFDGPTQDAISVYHDILSTISPDQQRASGELAREHDLVIVRDVRIEDNKGQPTAHIRAGELMRISVHLHAKELVEAPFAVVQVFSGDGLCIYSDNNMLSPYPLVEAGADVVWDIELTSRLPTGSYSVSVHIARAKSSAATVEDSLSDLAVLATPPSMTFYVEGRGMVHGLADLEGRFGVADRSTTVGSAGD
jgi:ABC-type polysaccharide/polyol phosphate transport system ATPase subunit